MIPQSKEIGGVKKDNVEWGRKGSEVKNNNVAVLDEFIRGYY